jgi:uncharacterized protein YkwD
MSMKNLKIIVAASFVAVLASCGGGGADSTTTTATSSTPIPLADCGLPDFKNEVLSRLNAYRASGLTCGTEAMAPTTPVVWNENLQQAATAHVTDMATHDFLSHTGSDGSTARQRQQRYGFNSTGFYFENAGAGQSTVAEVMLGWRNSAEHCKAMMNASVRQVAVSCSFNSATQYGYYWAMEGGT